MKKIVFISNYLTHHQLPFCDEMDRQENIDFTFVSTKAFSKERQEQGWKNEINRSYYVHYDSDSGKVKSKIDNADAVIIGSAPNELIKYRVKNKKLVFRYSERPLKNGIELKKYPLRLVKWHMQNPVNGKIYMLCASGYTAADYNIFGLFKEKAYKWGYFPETKEYTDIDSILSGKDSAQILWCGRFVDFKHIEYAIELAKRLKDNNKDFHLEIIGDGPDKEKLEKFVKQNNLSDKVSFLGVMSTEKVREKMEQTGIHIITSSSGEGWGAVVNEAMNSGCAVVSSNLVGAAPFLIKNNHNGLIFESGNINDLYSRVEYLLDNPEEQKRIGKNAYKTITEEWNAKTAADRFVNLMDCILNDKKETVLYSDGPCSKADVISEDWYK